MLWVSNKIKAKAWTIFNLVQNFHPNMIKEQVARAFTVFVGHIEASTE